MLHSWLIGQPASVTSCEKPSVHSSRKIWLKIITSRDAKSACLKGSRKTADEGQNVSCDFGGGNLRSVAVPVSSKEITGRGQMGGGGNVSWVEGSKTVLGEGLYGMFSPHLSFPPPLLPSDFLLSSLGLCKRELIAWTRGKCVRPFSKPLKGWTG